MHARQRRVGNGVKGLRPRRPRSPRTRHNNPMLTTGTADACTWPRTAQHDLPCRLRSADDQRVEAARCRRRPGTPARWNGPAPGLTDCHAAVFCRCGGWDASEADKKVRGGDPQKSAGEIERKRGAQRERTSGLCERVGNEADRLVHSRVHQHRKEQEVPRRERRLCSKANCWGWAGAEPTGVPKGRSSFGRSSTPGTPAASAELHAVLSAIKSEPTGQLTLLLTAHHRPR